MSAELLTGNVSINQTTGVATLTPGLAVDFYQQRLAIAKIPDPDHKKGCIVAADATPGTTSIQVDVSSGYLVGDVLGQFNYVNPVMVGGSYEPATFELKVSAIPDGTHLTIDTALPAGCTVKAGTKFGFEGTDVEWHDKVVGQSIKIRTQIGDGSNADAAAIVQWLTDAYATPFTGYVTTPTSAALDVLNVTFPTGLMVTFELAVTGRPATGFAARYNLITYGSVNRAAGGGAANVLVTDQHTDITAGSAVVAAAGNALNVKVTGVLATPWTWKATLRVISAFVTIP